MKESSRKWLEEQMAGMDASVIDEIYAEYSRTAPALYAELEEKRAAGEAFAVLDRIAHTLKGNAAMVGDTALFEVVQKWRETMAKGDQAAADEIWLAIGPEVRAIS